MWCHAVVLSQDPWLFVGPRWAGAMWYQEDIIGLNRTQAKRARERPTELSSHLAMASTLEAMASNLKESKHPIYSMQHDTYRYCGDKPGHSARCSVVSSGWRRQGAILARGSPQTLSARHSGATKAAARVAPKRPVRRRTRVGSIDQKVMER